MLKVACTGSGYFSQFHYDAWSRIEDVTVVGAMSRSKESAAETGCTPFDDLGEMLSATNPDLLDIITPPPTHLEFIKVALAHGIKTIICQKPFCNNIEEASKAVALAKQNGAEIIVHENFRFQPWYRAIKKAIDEGQIGDLHQITFRLRTGDGQGPKAYLDRQPYFQEMPRLLIHETGVHFIDTFCYLMGDPSGIYADLRKMNPIIAGEDAGYLIMDFADGRRAIFDGNRHLDHCAENHRVTLGECLVEGTEGSLTLDGNGAVSLRKFGSTSIKIVFPNKKWPGFGGDCVFLLQSHVVNAIKVGTPLENTAQEYMRVLELEKAAYMSHEEQRRIEVKSKEYEL
ncbi:Gfo/Idh/MocA family protein [Ahrensia kielensis]|uniref:Gfo/Idh/MocA family protein n=1 Tax=Ahrensia kielensis TaxID=76980 RepID=UPI000379282A|nr:Gfo/Idh/MocA family oxidoreductase [Ahrensia kielensis]